MTLTSECDIARVLSSARSIALLGASSNPDRPSYQVARFLVEEGYDVYPVNPGLAGQRLHGRAVSATLADVPVEVDMVDVFRQARFLPDIINQAVAGGVRIVWTQLGVVSDEAAGIAAENGLELVMDRCPAIEVPRLRSIGLL